MKAAVALLVVVTAAAAASPRAGAATPQDKKIAALQKQVAALTKQVKTLQLELTANYAGDACLTASTADTFQATWFTIDAYMTAQMQPRVFQPDEPGFTAVGDRGACTRLRVTRQPNQQPPFTSVFQAIVDWMLA